MNTRTTLRSLLVALVCALCIGVEACATQPPRIINIPPGELATALEKVAQQSDVELIFQPDQLKGLHTDGVVGMMTAQQAARKLLEGTRFQVRTDPDNGAMMVGATAAVGSESSSDGQSADTVVLTPLEEVEVVARRAELSVMREEMVKLEDQFYTEYNRRNSNHWWDVVCRMDNSPTGSRFRSRVCRPRFVDRGFNSSSGGGGELAHYSAFASGGRPLFLKWWSEYEKNMLDQIHQSPELRRLIREREALGERYEEARRQKLEGKIIVLD